MGMNIVEKIDNYVKVRTALISVSDKRGLGSFIPQLLEINPGIRLLSTGGTFNAIKDILKDGAQCLKQVSDYTGQPETQGGLVKTLDFKIYLGLLTETYNESHQNDLKRTGASPIDLVVVNLYPFKETISKPGVTVEAARGNIDIGGPCMLRAAAKNFIRVACVSDPDDYDRVLSEMKENKGMTTLNLRFQLAQKAFNHTALYDNMIAQYLRSQSYSSVKTCYERI